MSMTALTVVLTVAGILLYGAVVLYGAWIDGRRQAMREKGLHPVTDESGAVHGLRSLESEEESKDGSERR